MREESRGEENREQKGLEQHEQESSLTLLTVICRPHTDTHKLCNTCAIHPPTHTHLMYTEKNLPLYLCPMNTHTHGYAFTLYAALCHFDSDPPTASQQA